MTDCANAALPIVNSTSDQYDIVRDPAAARQRRLRREYPGFPAYRIAFVLRPSDLRGNGIGAGSLTAFGMERSRTTCWPFGATGRLPMWMVARHAPGSENLLEFDGISSEAHMHAHHVIDPRDTTQFRPMAVLPHDIDIFIAAQLDPKRSTGMIGLDMRNPNRTPCSWDIGRPKLATFPVINMLDDARRVEGVTMPEDDEASILASSRILGASTIFSHRSRTMPVDAFP